MTPQTAVLRIGNWRVDTVSGQMAREDEHTSDEAGAYQPPQPEIASVVEHGMGLGHSR
jgi:hypothetical protein